MYEEHVREERYVREECVREERYVREEGYVCGACEGGVCKGGVCEGGGVCMRSV